MLDLRESPELPARHTPGSDIENQETAATNWTWHRGIGVDGATTQRKPKLMGDMTCVWCKIGGGGRSQRPLKIAKTYTHILTHILTHTNNNTHTHTNIHTHKGGPLLQIWMALDRVWITWAAVGVLKQAVPPPPRRPLWPHGGGGQGRAEGADAEADHVGRVGGDWGQRQEAVDPARGRGQKRHGGGGVDAGTP